MQVTKTADPEVGRKSIDTVSTINYLKNVHFLFVSKTQKICKEIGQGKS